MAFSRSFCCVAIPLYNSGIYLLLLEQFIVSFAIAILALTTPSIISISIPSFGPYLLTIACFVVSICQFWGFWSVWKEKTRSFRLYVRSNAGCVFLAFAVALAWMALSMAKHSDRTTACVKQFSSSNSSISGESLCNICLWVQSGVMGGLWLLLFFAQLYFLKVSSIYGFEQRIDHKKYNSIYSAAGEELARQSMAWDARSSEDLNSPNRPFLNHQRTDSSVSKASGLRNELAAEPGSHAETQHQRQSYVQDRPPPPPPPPKGASDYHSAMYDQPYRDPYYQEALQTPLQASPANPMAQQQSYHDMMYGNAQPQRQSQYGQGSYVEYNSTPGRALPFPSDQGYSQSAPNMPTSAYPPTRAEVPTPTSFPPTFAAMRQTSSPVYPYGSAPAANTSQSAFMNVPLDAPQQSQASSFDGILGRKTPRATSPGLAHRLPSPGEPHDGLPYRQ